MNRAYRFGVSAVDDDPVAVGCGGHLTGWTGAGAGSWWLEATPGKRVQIERVDIIIIDVIPAEQKIDAFIEYCKLYYLIFFYGFYKHILQLKLICGSTYIGFYGSTYADKCKENITFIYTIK